MTDRLYYHDSFLYDFDAEVSEVIESPRPALILNRTAFYPTSGRLYKIPCGDVTPCAFARFAVRD